MKITGVILSFDDVCSQFSNANGNVSWAKFMRTSDKMWTKEEIEERFETDIYTDKVCFEDALTADLFDGGSVVIVDCYENTEVDAPHYLTLSDFVNGIKIVANHYPTSFANHLTERCDINDADIFLQCATFGDVIYG